MSKIEACSLRESETIILPFSFRFGGCGTYIEPENNSEGVLLCFGQSWRDQCYWSKDLESNQWTNIGTSQLSIGSSNIGSSNLKPQLTTGFCMPEKLTRN